MANGYHPANLKLVDYPDKDIIALAECAYRRGVLIHIDGLPFGYFDALRPKTDDADE